MLPTPADGVTEVAAAAPPTVLAESRDGASVEESKCGTSTDSARDNTTRRAATCATARFAKNVEKAAKLDSM